VSTREAKPIPPPLAGLTLLVVEDHPDTLELLRQMVEALGATAVLARDGTEALDRLQSSAHMPSSVTS
jgi:CheY-like chemotaxis protein